MKNHLSSEYNELSEERKLDSTKETISSQKQEINEKDEILDNEMFRKSIRLLTYNIFCRPPPINSNQGDYKDARINDFINRLQYFDIICFQELFTTLNDRKHKMICEGAKKGLKYYLYSKPPSIFSKYPVDSGLLILSKFEIVEHDFFPFYLNIMGDAPCNKGVLYAKIKINNKYLFLFSTHLQASYLDDTQKNIDNTIQVRTAQTEELINFVYNKLLEMPRDEVKSGLVIIAGDFNIDAHDNKFAKEKYKIPNYNSTEYIIFKQKLNKLGKAIDLMENKYKDHLYTFGNNDKEEYDHILITKADLNIRQTLDYIWELIPDYNLDIYKQSIHPFNKSFSFDDKNIEKNKMKVLYDTLKVEEFLIKDRPYQQLSDHFGLSVELDSPLGGLNLTGPFLDSEDIEFPFKGNK